MFIKIINEKLIYVMEIVPVSLATHKRLALEHLWQRKGRLAP